MENVITFAHSVIKDHITKNSIVIDATIGNGHDTVFLAKNAKHVFGFDIQKKAIDNTAKRCQEANLNNISLFLDSHANIKKYVNQTVDAVIFNLGYLPQGDKTITTNALSTISSIESALSILSVKGIIALTIYIGHEEGKAEQKSLEDFLSAMDSALYTVIRYQHVNKDTAPYTVCIQKK